MRSWLARLGLALCLLTVLAGAEPAAAQDLAGRTLLVRGDEAYPPYEFLGPDGQPTGFNVEMFRAIAKVMGLKAEISLGPWDEIRGQLERGDIDVITGMYYSPDRAERVDFCNPHIIVTYAIFVREGEKIKAFDDLGRKNILVQKGDYADDYLSQHFPLAGLRRVANPSEALKALAAGQADCALVPRTIGLLLERRHGLNKLATVGAPVLHRKYCFAVKKGDAELLASLNEGLAILHASGEFERIYNTWFGEIERHSAMDQAIRWALMGLAPLVLLFALAFLWTWSLKRQVNKKTEELVGQLNERRRAEMALQESEERLRLITDNLPNAVLFQVRATRAGKWKFTYISANVQRANEVTVEAVLADPNTIFGQLDPDYRQACADAMREAMAQRQAFRFETPCILPSGRRRWFELASTPRRLEDNSMVWDGVQVDITERMQHEEEKGRLEALLRQSQKMEALGTLSGGIAHDFNNILGVIMGYAEVAQLLSEEGQPNHQEVGQIVRAAERARGLVRQILTFSRRVEANLRPLEINQVITQIVALLEHTLPKMIEVKCQFGAGLGLVNADANQLEQLFLNLATNAADAMPDGGQLVIETRLAVLDEEYSRRHLETAPGRYVLIVVSDTGQGMDQATQEKMFEPFFTTKEVGKGTGLGLSTVFGIVKGHEGHVRCYSQPGQGTSFYVYLPSYEADHAPADDEGRLADGQLRGSETVLLVDDEEGLRESAAKVLGDMGYQVLTAVSGEQALALRAATEQAIDLVIMDLGMPGMGGRECTRAMLADDPATRIIIASGYATAGQEKLVKESGARGFLPKPFNRIDLLIMVRQVLEA